MDKNTRKNIYKRLMKVATISTIVVIMLALRLFWIQIVNGQEYRTAADKQHIREIRIAPARGNIFDRNNIQLTNNVTEKTVYIFKDTVLNDNQSLKDLKDVLELTDSEIEQIKKSSNRIVEIPLKKVINEDIFIKGVVVTDKVIRYDDSNLLSHIIGYVKKSENVGEYGIEKEYDSILKMDDQYGIKTITVDGKQRLIPGLEDTAVLFEKKSTTNSIKLAIDIKMQKVIEEVFDKSKKNGAIIVNDVVTGDILAMASRPNLDQNDVETHFSSEKMDFYNKALEVPYPPGSIFKTVVMLAALEDGSVRLDDTFICEGYEDLGNIIIKCNNANGHGHITALEAFAESCNSTFIQIGKRVGAEKIIKMAKKIGFGEKIQDKLIEATGNLPKDDELLGPAIGNISIGQLNIEVTPLQVSNMMTIIANDGIKKELAIVHSIVTEDGQFVKEVKRLDDKRVLPTSVSDQIKKCLEEVVAKGTAKSINMLQLGGAAGKTGSAESSKDKTHAWFSGYFPTHKPKYVITVFIEEGNSGSGVAVPIFEKIANEILIIENESKH